MMTCFSCKIIVKEIRFHQNVLLYFFLHSSFASLVVTADLSDIDFLEDSTTESLLLSGDEYNQDLESLAMDDFPDEDETAANEIVRCICEMDEENGFMIQVCVCDACLRFCVSAPTNDSPYLSWKWIGDPSRVTPLLPLFLYLSLSYALSLSRSHSLSSLGIP